MPSDFVAQPPYAVLQPGAYSAVDASLLAAPASQVAPPVPVIVGVTQGGTPLKPMYFRSPGLLAQVCKGGPAYDVARFAFDGGASMVGIVRVGNSVAQGTLTLAGSAGTCITLTSKDYGAWTNSILVTVAAGPVITLLYTDPSGNKFTETWNLTGVGSLTNSLIASAINGTLAGYNQSAFVTAVAGAGTLPMTAVSNQPLAGGSDGTTPAAGDWTNGLAALEPELIDFVVAATGDATVHAQVQTHCQNMSTPLVRRERVQVCGGVLAESVTQANARQAALASARTQLVYPGIYDYNSSGTLTLWDPFYAAGKIAGMHCGQQDVATSLVHKKVPCVDVEVKLSTAQGGAIDQLLQGNVTPLAPAAGGGIWVVDSLTGYTGADKVFHDVTKTRAADYVSQYARTILENKYVGSKNLLTSQDSMAKTATGLLQRLQDAQLIRQFLAPTVSQGPDQNTWLVSLPVMLIDTTKFILIQVQLQSSQTLAAAA